MSDSKPMPSMAGVTNPSNVSSPVTGVTTGTGASGEASGGASGAAPGGAPAQEALEIVSGYAFAGPALDLGALLWGGQCLADEQSLGLIFHYADRKGLELVDLKDLRALVTFLTSDEERCLGAPRSRLAASRKGLFVEARPQGAGPRYLPEAFAAALSCCLWVRTFWRDSGPVMSATERYASASP